MRHINSFFAKGLFFISVCIFFSSLLAAQSTITYKGSGGYSLVERTDLRRYENGKYKGLTSREVRSFISPSESPNGMYAEDRWYDGSFYVNEETLRNTQSVTAGIHDSIPSVFRISANGKLTMYEDNGYPSFRSFPSFPSEKVKIGVGDRWNAMAERSVDPLYKGIFTKLQMYVQYEFAGEEVYKGEAVYRIKAMWQTNYGMSYTDRRGDPDLQKALGGHKADIIVRKATGEAILVIDTVDETFVYRDGLQVQFKGRITLFTEFPPAVEHEKILPALAKIATVVPQTKQQSNQSKTVSTTTDTTTTKGNTNDTAKQTKTDTKKQKEVKAEKVDDIEFIDWDNVTKVASKDDEGKTKQTETDSSKQSDTTKQTETKQIDSDTKNEKNTEEDVAKTKEATKEEKRAETIAKITAKQSEEENNGTKQKNNMVVEETAAGIRLSMRDIRFKPDSDEVLPSESYRLDEIAKVLKMVPDSQFLVEGHTAAVGRPQGEKTLSEQRAHKIAEELAKRGIPATSFITRGLGGTKPVAPNTTEAGKAQNRRVEITILE